MLAQRFGLALELIEPVVPAPDGTRRVLGPQQREHGKDAKEERCDQWRVHQCIMPGKARRLLSAGRILACGCQGGTGKSFNSYNAETGAWQQNWMDESGDVSNFEDGHVVNGVLSFVARKVNPAGHKFLSRLTFFDLGPDEVRQFGEQSDDDGKTWGVRYDFDYQRVK